MTQFTPMKFEEGVTATIRAVGSSVGYEAVSLDLQKGGVLFDYVNPNTPFDTRRLFLPWSHVGSISQPVQE